MPFDTEGLQIHGGTVVYGACNSDKQGIVPYFGSGVPLATAYSAAAAAAADAPADDISHSGAAVLATPALVARICTGLDSAADGANLRQACKQTASSLDWFDLMWCARHDIPKVHTAIKQHASVIVPVARIKKTITGSLGDVWSCPPLLKWMVLEAAKQGDAELLGTVLGRKQQLQQDEQQQQQQEEQQQRGSDGNGGDMLRNELRVHNALKSCGDVLRELDLPTAVATSTTCDAGFFVRAWLTAKAAEEDVHSNNTQLLMQMVQEGWFQGPLPKRKPAGPISRAELSGAFVVTSLKQQLAPAFLAAAAAGDVEAGKVLLSNCPDLLDYVLWNSPADIRTDIIDG